MKYKMYLVLGDWSNDGHGKSDKILLESNFPVEVIQKAYKDSCKMTGVSFNHNNDFTGVGRDYQEADNFHICTEYESGIIPFKAMETLEKHGLTGDKLQEFYGKDDYISDYINNDKSVGLTEPAFINLWIWFVQIANPAIELKIVKDDIPVINGYWNKELNVQFGYGLYS